MKMVVNRKEWRDRTVTMLIQAKSIDAFSAIEEAKKLEAYVFSDDFIVEVADPDQRTALKRMIEKLCHADQLDAGQSCNLRTQPLHQESVMKHLEANRDRLRQLIIAHNKAKRTNLLKKTAHLIKDKLFVRTGHAKPQ